MDDMTIKELREHLVRLGACAESIEWIDSLRVTVTLARDAWDACDRVEWLIWLIDECGYGVFLKAFSISCAHRAAPIAESWLETHAPEYAGAPTRALEGTACAGWVRWATRECVVWPGYVPWPDGLYATRAVLCAIDAIREFERVGWNAVNVSDDAAVASPRPDAERAMQLASLRELIRWDDVERALRGAT